jgi:hypothetical protein
MCPRGWKVLDAYPSRELNHLRPEECDCPYCEEQTHGREETRTEPDRHPD